MTRRYAPLPNPLAPDADHELNAAFQSDEEEEEDQREESTPLNPHNTSPESVGDPLTQAQASYAHDSDGPTPRPTIPGAYDFEADPFDYTVPPPGSPPGPTTFALPNQYGNSNGLLPSKPVIPRRSVRGMGFFRRTVGALLPSHYQRVPTEEGTPAGPVRGGGTNNDGVFANMAARPGRGRVVQDGESIHVVPEEVQKEVPPSYAVAQADSAPAYYETIIHAPSSGFDGEVLVDAMPTGSIFTFAWTMLISLSFQFVGFLLTYLLHTTHAAKFGSRAGLGITIIQYAFFLRRRVMLVTEGAQQEGYQGWWESNGPTADGEPKSMPDFNATIPDGSGASTYPGYFGSSTTQWLSFIMMSVGWFVLLTSLLGFLRVKRWEHGIRQANDPQPPLTAEALERDRNIRSSLMAVFGIPLDDEEELEVRQVASGPNPDPELEEDGDASRLASDLRASGLL